MFSSNGTQVSGAANYIEDVFSTYLYTGNGSTQTITNGINLSAYGGLVWLKNRTADGSYTAANYVVDSARSSFRSYLITNATNTADPETAGKGVTSVSTTGFVLGTSNISTNTSAVDYVSWTLRKQPKFFDIVTFTGDGTTGRTIAHNLGSEPGCIIVKRTDSTSNWTTYHREDAARAISLNLTVGAYGTPCWGSVAPTSTTFTVSLESAASVDRQININSATYVAYLFAHNAGGFGLSGTDNVISCGSYTGNGSATGPVVTLGYEPQWLMIKKYLPETGSAGNWQILDSMRGMPVGSADATLQANLSADESSVEYASPTATGFQITSTLDVVNESGGTFIYIAIRRGPMKVPTLGTSVYKAQIRVGNGSAVTINGAGFPPDLILSTTTDTTNGPWFIDKLRGINQGLSSATIAAEATDAGNVTGFSNIGFSAGSGAQGWTNGPTYNYVYQFFQRAPSFFDEVCYAGTNTTGPSISHNLGAVPELMIVKNRTTATNNWWVYSASLGNTSRLFLNDTSAVGTGSSAWTSTSPTSSVFTVGTSAGSTNGITSENFVAYLFATCAGVSKVGSYTGNGTTQTINCGFTGGARFVLIKRTDSTGGWYVYDTTRGMTTLTDPYLLLNSQAAEVATLGSVTTVSTGFALDSAILADINVSAGSYIFLAVA